MKQSVIFALIIFNLHGQAQTSFPDTSKLQDFTRQIANSSIIGLGEPGHGYESINETKAALVEVLQKRFDFDAISFESSFTESIVSFLVDSTADARAENFLYPFWNTASVKTVLKVFLDKEKHNPLVTGFDIQEDCRFTKFSKLLIGRQLVSENKGRLLACDSILSYYIGKNFSRKSAISEQEYALLIHNYEIIQTEVNVKEQATVYRKLLEHCINNRMWLCKYLTLKTSKDKMYYRDSLMAENIAWLQKELYNDNKLIVWAANTHIAKSTSRKEPRWTGEWLSLDYKTKYYSIAVEKGVTDETFFLTNTSYKYFSNPYEKFNLVIYLDKLKKIKSSGWVTPCD